MAQHASGVGGTPVPGGAHRNPPPRAPHTLRRPRSESGTGQTRHCVVDNGDGNGCGSGQGRILLVPSYHRLRPQDSRHGGGGGGGGDGGGGGGGGGGSSSVASNDSSYSSASSFSSMASLALGARDVEPRRPRSHQRGWQADGGDGNGGGGREGAGERARSLSPLPPEPPAPPSLSESRTTTTTTTSRRRRRRSTSGSAASAASSSSLSLSGPGRSASGGFEGGRWDRFHPSLDVRSGGSLLDLDPGADDDDEDDDDDGDDDDNDDNNHLHAGRIRDDVPNLPFANTEDYRNGTGDGWADGRSNQASAGGRQAALASAAATPNRRPQLRQWGSFSTEGRGRSRSEPPQPQPQLSSSSAAGASDATSVLYGGGAEMVRRLLLLSSSSATKGRRMAVSDSAAVAMEPDREAVEATGAETAVDFARSAPRAGYLHKLGTNVKHYKRRFFVLRPSTHLYYFLSPHDTEPRGCIELGGGGPLGAPPAVRELETLPDGRFRFEIAFDDADDDAGGLDSSFYSVAANDAPGGGGFGNRRRIVLEARDAEIGREWMQSLRTESLVHARSELDAARSEADGLRSRVLALESELEEMRLVERDRDEAVRDAREWKDRHWRLDEAVRLLAGWVGRPPPEAMPGGQDKEEEEGDDGGGEGKKGVGASSERRSAGIGEMIVSGGSGGGSGSDSIEKGGCVGGTDENRPAEVTNDDESTVSVKVATDSGIGNGNGIAASALRPEINPVAPIDQSPALAGLADDDRALDDGLDRLRLAGTGLPSLVNACRRLRDNLRATSEEADAAVRDMNAASAAKSEAEERLGRAERELCRLWEENCDLRDAIRKFKREKRVLVKEIKSMREEAAERMRAGEVAEAVRRRQDELIWSPSEGTSDPKGLISPVKVATNRDDCMARAGSIDDVRTVPADGRDAMVFDNVERCASSPQDRPASVPSPDLPVTNAQEQSTPVLNNASKQLLAQKEREERRLILELEEHVMAGLRLHEQLIAAAAPSALVLTRTDSANVIFSRTIESDVEKRKEFVAEPLDLSSTAIKVVRSEDVDPASTVQKNRWNEAKKSDDVDETQSPIYPMKLSLLDNESGDDDASVLEDDSISVGTDQNKYMLSQRGNSEGIESQSLRAHEPITGHDRDAEPSVAPFQTLSNPILSHNPNADLNQCRSNRTIPIRLFQNECGASSPDPSQRSTDTERRKRHPLLKLDAGVTNEDDSVAGRFSTTTANSETSRSVVMQTGSATALLSCPLADVIETKKLDSTDSDSVGRKGEIYHLTFYTQKIGLQFQKVPALASYTGALTDAMTSDVRCASTGKENEEDYTSYGELRKIAAIASQAGKSREDRADEFPTTCQVAMPVDFVLVCGFHGFDDSNSNQRRPRLGARLVAFDGVSVEIGRWTFESVRKAIQSRGRPLTLSFRDEFLTMEQRAILTKAVAETKTSTPAPQPLLQYRMPPFKNPSGAAKQITRTIHAPFPGDHAYTTPNDKMQSRAHRNNYEQAHNSSQRLASNTHATAEVQRNTQADLRPSCTIPSSHSKAFSDVGSSSVFSSTFRPLIAGLLQASLMEKGSSHPQTPRYLRRNSESLDSIERHKQFTAGLL